MSGTPLPMTGGQPPSNRFGVPTTPMHAMSPGMGHGSPMGVNNPQQMAQSQRLYQGQSLPGSVGPHKGNPNVPVPPLDPGLVPNGLPGPLLPAESRQRIGQLGMSRPSKSSGEGELDAPPNPAGSAPTTRPLHNSAPPKDSQLPPTAEPGPSAPAGAFDMTTWLAALPDLDSGPGSLTHKEPWYNPAAVQAPPAPVPRPVSRGDLSFDMTTCLAALPDLDSGPGSLTLKELWYNRTAVHEGWHTPPPPAPGPRSMGDLSFDMTDMFANTGGDSDFGTGPLTDMESWFDPVDVYDSLSVPAPPAPGPRSRRDLQSHMTAMVGSTGGDSDFCPGSPTDTEPWLGPTAVHNGSPAPAPPAPGPRSGNLSFDMTDMFDGTPGDFDFGTGSLTDPKLWFDQTTLHDSLPAPSPPAPGSRSRGDLTFDMTDMFASAPGDFDFGTPLTDMELWFDPSAVHDGSIDTK